MKNKDRYSEEAIRKLIADNPYANMTELSKISGIRRDTISRKIKQYDITYNPSGSLYSTKTQESLMTLLTFMKKNKHYTNVRIASITGIHKNTIGTLRKQYNIPYPDNIKLSKMSSIDKIKKIKKTIREHPEATIVELAQMLDMSYTSVAQFIIDYDIPYEYKNETNTFDSMVLPKEMQKLIDTHPNWTYTQISTYYGVSQNTIIRYIKKHKLRYHSKGNQPTVKDRLTKDAIESLIKRYPNWKRKDYAQHLNVALPTFNMYVRRLNININDLKEAILCQNQ